MFGFLWECYLHSSQKSESCTIHSGAPMRLATCDERINCRREESSARHRIDCERRTEDCIGLEYADGSFQYTRMFAC